jgi:hypothetical protein
LAVEFFQFLAAELYDSGGYRKQSVVFANADIGAGVVFGTALADQDGTRFGVLAVM